MMRPFLALLLIIGPLISRPASAENSSARTELTPLSTKAPLLPSPAARDTWLRWSAPPECPTDAQIYARVKKWLGKDLVTTSPLEVNASVSWDKAAWIVAVEHSYGKNVGQRAVSVDSCTEAADFVALTVVLAVEPGFEAPAQVSEIRETQDVPSVVVPRSKEESLQPAPNPESQVQVQPKSEIKWLQGFIELGVVGSWGALPEFAWGTELHLGLKTGQVEWVLGGFYQPPFTHVVDEADSDIRVSLLSALFSTCYLFERGRMRGGPCLGGEWGSLKAEEKSTDDEAQGGRTIWGALLAGGQIGWSFNSVLSTHFSSNLLLPLTRTRLELSDGTEVFATNSAGVEGKWSMRIFF